MFLLSSSSPESSSSCDTAALCNDFPVWSSSFSPLLSLPPELHHAIASHLCHTSDIHHLSQTCSYFAMLTAAERLTLAATDKHARALRRAAETNNTSFMRRLLSKSVEVHKKILVEGESDDDLIWLLSSYKKQKSALEIAMEEGRGDIFRVMLECAREVVVARLATSYCGGMEMLAGSGDVEMLKAVLGYIREEKKKDEDGRDDSSDEDRDRDEKNKYADSGSIEGSDYEEEVVSRMTDKQIWERVTIAEAGRYGKVAAVEFLLDNGFWSPEIGHAAIGNGHLDVLRMLDSRGLLQKNNNNRRHRKSVKVQDLLESAINAKKEEAVKFLVENGASVNAITDIERGFTPAHLAAVQEQPAMIELLLSLGADINAITQDEDEKFSLPLHLASESHGTEVLELMLKHGVDDINATDSDGKTALHRCAEAYIDHNEDDYCPSNINMGGLYCAWILLQHGAAVDQVDLSGYTPMDAAVKSGRLGQARLFLMVRTRRDYYPELLDENYSWWCAEVEAMGKPVDFY